MNRGAIALIALVFPLFLLRPQAQGVPASPAAPKDSLKFSRDSALAHRPQGAKDSGVSKEVQAKPKTRADSVTVPKHTFNHRQQIITGSVVMSCLLLILLAMNNYNPR
jgi:hypothetical protein